MRTWVLTIPPPPTTGTTRVPCPLCHFDYLHLHPVSLTEGTHPEDDTGFSIPCCSPTGPSLVEETLSTFLLKRKEKPPSLLKFGSILRPTTVLSVSGQR